MGRFFGYARVSTKEQNAERQIAALREFGISAENIFVDKHSGKNFERPAYKALLEILEPADILIVKSIDRLGRNYSEIIEQWRLITREKRVEIVVLDMPILDTRRNKDLLGNLITDLVLNLLSYFAQIEREFNRQRQAEGIAAAKARGVKFGREPLEKPAAYDAILKDWQEGKISARGAAKKLGVTHSTFLNWARNKTGK